MRERRSAKVGGKIRRRPASRKPAGGNLPAFAMHPLRSAALGEIHARPIPAIGANRVVLQWAFGSEGGIAKAEAVLGDIARGRGLAAPASGVRYHVIPWGKGALRWERHSEFTTFSWDGPAPKYFLGELADHPFGAGFSEPGKLISANRVEVRPLTPANLKLLARFDSESLCVSLLEDGRSLVATDFRQNGDGMTVFLLLEHNMPSARIGYFTKMATDIETYRTLALLGLPFAQSLSGRISALEASLGQLTSSMRTAGPEEARKLLDEITGLSGELEAAAAASLYRFGATRAYGEIVEERLVLLGNRAARGYKDIANFLDLRLGPALRTCRSVEERQSNLSTRLARTTELLRTRVQVGMEEQNRTLLESMNRRARIQLRLQQTVEGLSVAAISYYLVGLFNYFIEFFGDYLPAGLTPKMATGLFVPAAILLVWFLIRRIRLGNLADS